MVGNASKFSVSDSSRTAVMVTGAVALTSTGVVPSSARESPSLGVNPSCEMFSWYVPAASKPVKTT